MSVILFISHACVCVCWQWKAQATKDGLLFLLDCSKSMFEQVDEGQCHFQLAIRVCSFDLLCVLGSFVLFRCMFGHRLFTLYWFYVISLWTHMHACVCVCVCVCESMRKCKFAKARARVCQCQ